MKAKLTRTLIEKLNTPGVTWDAQIPGFGLRVYPSLRKSYILMYRDRTKRLHLYTIANYPETTPERARQEAMRLKTAIRLEGHDPLKAKDMGVKFDVLVEHYETERISNKRSGSKDKFLLERYVKPEFSGEGVYAITQEDVRRWHRRIGSENGEVAANRALTLLAAVFNYGIKRGTLPTDFIPPTRGVTAFKETARSRVLTLDEIKAIWLGAEGYAVDFRCFIRLALVTGMRFGEIIDLDRREVNLENMTITIPEERSKNKKPLLYCLSTVAVSVLREAMENLTGDKIFGGFVRRGYYRRRFAELLKEVGLEDVHIHDLRRCFATLAGVQGVPFHIISKMLNHSKLDVTSIYAKAPDEALRSAAETVGKLLAAKGEAVPFNTGK